MKNRTSQPPAPSNNREVHKNVEASPPTSDYKWPQNKCAPGTCGLGRFVEQCVLLQLWYHDDLTPFIQPLEG